jgi:hypothetical protein
MRKPAFVLVCPDKTEALRPSHRLGALFNGELPKDLLDVRLNRLGRNVQRSGDVLVGLSLADHFHDSAFPSAERPDNARRRADARLGLESYAPSRQQVLEIRQEFGAHADALQVLQCAEEKRPNERPLLWDRLADARRRGNLTTLRTIAVA